MSNYNLLTINQNALRSNIETLKKKCRIMAIVKGNGYGIGNVALAKAVQSCGIDILGVAHLDEAVLLRKQGIEGAIFVISAPLFELEKAVIYDLEVALSSAKEALRLNELAKKANKMLKVHLHIDTGMHRFGCTQQQSIELYHLIEHLSHIKLEGVMSHFIGSALPEFDLSSQNQIKQFASILDTMPQKPPYIHLACSGSLRRFTLPQCNMARIGLGLFGLHTTEEEQRLFPLTPALTLTSRLHSIQECAEGESIGYCHSAVMKHKKGKVGIIPFGYHDGMPISLSKEAYLLVRNKKAPILGKICMDFTLLDLSEIEEAALGDEVVIFSPTQRAEQLAKWADINVRVLLSQLGARVEKKFIDIIVA